MPLATQQAKVIQNETDLRTKQYIGEMGVDSWKKEQWLKELNENNVLVMTAQIFLNLLNDGVLGLSDVNLLIFDECHHARKSHPYKQIMQHFKNDCLPNDKYPRVMGLTASVINGKVRLGKIEAEIKNLEATLRSKCETSEDEEVLKYATKPTEKIIHYSNESIEETAKDLVHLLNKRVIKPGLALLEECRISNEEVKNGLQQCQEILESLGPWSAHQVSGYLIQDLGMDVTCDIMGII